MSRYCDSQNGLTLLWRFTPEVAEEDERVEPALGHQASREREPPLHLRGREPHASCSRSQSAVSGRYLYGMLLQTWLPSS